MTQNQFLALCNEHHIDPSVALEHPAIVEALKDRDDEAVIAALTNDF
jgi:DNA-binding GntR family transcriptional regulator